MHLVSYSNHFHIVWDNEQELQFEVWESRHTFALKRNIMSSPMTNAPPLQFPTRTAAARHVTPIYTKRVTFFNADVNRASFSAFFLLLLFTASAIHTEEVLHVMCIPSALLPRYFPSLSFPLGTIMTSKGLLFLMNVAFSSWRNYVFHSSCSHLFRNEEEDTVDLNAPLRTILLRYLPLLL